MRVIQIKNSYKVWRTDKMRRRICREAIRQHGGGAYEFIMSGGAQAYLHRSSRSMYIEWYLHNIGYYISLPLKKWKFWQRINDRCRDVDLEERSRT